MTTDAEFDQTVRRLLGELARDLGTEPTEFEMDSKVRRARLDGQILRVPTAYRDHVRRFGIVPTALVRDLAYEVARAKLSADPAASPAAVEADAVAYAEAFLHTFHFES